jgi:hypothetical protein
MHRNHAPAFVALSSDDRPVSTIVFAAGLRPTIAFI